MITRTSDKVTVTADQFTWNVGERCYSAEASDLGWRAGFWPAAISLAGQRTARVVELTARGFMYNQDGDLEFIEYRLPVPSTLNFTVRIYND